MSLVKSLEAWNGEIQTICQQAANIFAACSGNSSKGQSKFMELLGKGLSPSDIFDIPEQQLTALYLHGCHLMQSKQLAQAKEIFLLLIQLQTHEERNIYALAAAYQLEGNFETAGRLYVLFLQKAISNVQGRTRLGECYLACSDHPEAIQMFKLAIEAGREQGKVEETKYAKKMLKFAKKQMRTKTR